MGRQTNIRRWRPIVQGRRRFVDLAPFCLPWLVFVVQFLRHDPFQVKSTYSIEQRPTAPDEQFRFLQSVTLDNLIQNVPSFFQWQGPNIFPLIEQEVKNHIDRITSPE